MSFANNWLFNCIPCGSSYYIMPRRVHSRACESCCTLHSEFFSESSYLWVGSGPKSCHLKLVSRGQTLFRIGSGDVRLAWNNGCWLWILCETDDSNSGICILQAYVILRLTLSQVVACRIPSFIVFTVELKHVYWFPGSNRAKNVSPPVQSTS